MDILRLWFEETKLGYNVTRIPHDQDSEEIGLIVEGLTQNTKGLIFEDHVEIIRAGMYEYLGNYRPEIPEFFDKLRDALLGVYRGTTHIPKRPNS